MKQAVVLHPCKCLLFSMSQLPVSAERHKAPSHQCIWNHLGTILRAMSALNAGRNTLFASVDTASGHVAGTASSFTGSAWLRCLFTTFSYLLSSFPHFLCLSSAHAFGCMLSPIYMHSITQTTLSTLSAKQHMFTHQPYHLHHPLDCEHPKAQTLGLFCSLLYQGKGWQHYKQPAQGLGGGHSQAEFWSPAILRLKSSDLGGNLPVTRFGR